MGFKKAASKDWWICKSERVYDPTTPFMPNNSTHQRRWEQLTMGHTKKQVVSSVAPHKKAMKELGIYGDIKHIFARCGFEDWMKIMSYNTYKNLVVEFFSTFEPIMDESSACIGWRYSINNVVFETRKDLICGSLFSGRKQSLIIPSFTEVQRVTTWKRLTGLDEYDSNCSPKCIRSGTWKYVHRLIATNINTRVDEGGRVSKDDLDLLYWMERRRPIDWFHVFTERFRRMTNVKEKSKALGCASIITSLAKLERFKFECPFDEFRALDIPRVVTMHMFNPKAKEWIYQPVMPKNASRKGKAPMQESSWE